MTLAGELAQSVAQSDAAQAAAQVAQTGINKNLSLHEAPPAWVAVLIILPALLGITWLSYRAEPLTSAARTVLSSLRFGSLLLLLLIICRPVVIERRINEQPAEVLVLFDDSASMQRKEVYGGRENLAEAVDELSSGAPLPRLGLARRAFESKLAGHLEEHDYEVRMFRFGESISTLNSLGELSGAGHASHLGDALGQVLGANRGRPVTDLLLISDGRSTGGVPAMDAARSAAAAGIPIHTIVVGDTRPERNAILELIEAPQSALEGDELGIAVRVTGRGVSESASVVLEELDEDGNLGNSTRLVAEQEVELSERGERVVLIAPPGQPGASSGLRRFRVSVPPLAGETLTDDNQRELSVRVSPEKIRVLYIEGYPRWEYRRLALDLLKRGDANIEFQCFLLSATPNFPQESSELLPSLLEVPTTRRELLESYDVVILGDINPSDLSPDPEKVEEFAQSLREFVESGGGVLFQAGEQDNPRSFVLNDTLRDLLPVVLDAGGLQEFAGDTRFSFRPVLEEPGNPHEIARLNPDLAINRSLWEDENGLSGFFWYSPVKRAKPGSVVVLRHPTDMGSNGERNPLLVTGYYPAGRTMFLGFDSTWRWYRRFGKRYHEHFWRSAIRWLALGRLRSGDRRYRIETPRNTYNLDERIPLEARVLDEDYRPSVRPSQSVRWSGEDGEGGELELIQVADKPGLYRGALEVGYPGLFRAWIEVDNASSAQHVSSTEFEVILPSRENQEPTPDPETMAALARMTGGRAVDLAGLDDLLAEFPGGEERREPVSSRLRDAWDNWWTLLGALLLLSTEWILRKRWELV